MTSLLDEALDCNKVLGFLSQNSFKVLSCYSYLYWLYFTPISPPPIHRLLRYPLC